MANPGLRGQIEMQGPVGELELDLFESMDEYEGDINQAAAAHREYEKESRARAELLQYQIVKQKYFKPAVRHSFLTWAEIVQIRDLHKKDPEEWSVESLAESFPATEETIKKIVKSKWQPKDMKKAQKHDESVQRTWQAFKANKLSDLDPDLAEHLKKFSGREFDPASSKFSNEPNALPEFKFPEPKSGEFTHLLKSCPQASSKVAKTKAVEQIKTDVQLVESHRPVEPTVARAARAADEDTFLMSNIKGRKYKRLEDVQKKKLIKGDVKAPDEELGSLRFGGKSIKKEEPIEFEENELIAVYPPKKSEDDHVVSLDKESLANIQQYRTTAAPALSKYSSHEMPVDRIREKIYIPRKMYKKGKIYKLYDCFYDDDGMLLYRVPGLTGSKHA